MDCATEDVKIWSASEGLSDRVRKLREEYFSFYTRDYFRNEVMPFSTGDAWDVLWSPHQWTIVPEYFPFHKGTGDVLQAAATRVELPRGFRSEPLAVRRAIFFARVIEQYLPVQILEGELIVGGQFNAAMSRTLTRSESRALKARMWDWQFRAVAMHNAGIGNCGAIPGHIIPNYRKVLEIGFRGLMEDIEKKAQGAPREKAQFLRALRICCEAVPRFAARYAAEAEKLSREESDGPRREELQRIAAVCRHVPWEPPQTFHEALQALWFTHMLVMTAESYPGPGLSYGRIDQYLLPFYEEDLRAGRLTRDAARELLQCFFIKHNYAYDYQGRIGTNQGINSGFGQLITLGGTGPGGEDATNDLTWLLLDVIEDMNLLEPKPNVRVHRGTPEALLRRMCEMVSRAQGAPFLLNFDEASIRGLRWQGLPEDRLWDYAPVGCLENTLQGDDRSGTVDVNLNLAKAVELALNDGCDMATGQRLGPATGDPAKFASWQAFRAAVETQLTHLTDTIIRLTSEADALRARFEPTPYLSLLVDGCADSGKDVTAGGARHNYITVEGVGFATLVDAVAAVRKLVYEKQLTTMPQLVAALKNNFEGEEKLRQLCLNRAPKYGADDDETDTLARELSQLWSGRAFTHVSPTGKRFRGGYLSWNYWICYAPLTAATPDGRKRGTYLSNGIGAVTGSDAKGPTAAVLSVGKCGLETIPNGGSHTLTLNPSLLRDPEHVEKLGAFLRGYCESGGTALQINMIDAETLRAAQRDPAEYRNLLVRVTGYNAYFVMLGREIQNEIISRESGQR